MTDIENTEPAAQPPAKGGIVAYLSLDGASAASEFYQHAFAAQEVSRMAGAEDDRLMHCHLYINDASLMLSDPFPEFGHPAVAAAGYTLTLNIKTDDDIHGWFKRAVDAGCTELMPVKKMFWGDTYGQLRDPYGVVWAMNQPGT